MLRIGKTYKGPKSKEADVEISKEQDDAEKEERAKKKVEVERRMKEFEKIELIPFPNRLEKQADEKNYTKYLNMFRSLHINILLADALEQMPKYEKYLKDILTKKHKPEEHEIMTMT